LGGFWVVKAQKVWPVERVTRMKVGKTKKLQRHPGVAKEGTPPTGSPHPGPVARGLKTCRPQPNGLWGKTICRSERGGGNPKANKRGGTTQRTERTQENGSCTPQPPTCGNPRLGGVGWDWVGVQFVNRGQLTSQRRTHGRDKKTPARKIRMEVVNTSSTGSRLGT